MGLDRQLLVGHGNFFLALIDAHVRGVEARRCFCWAFFCLTLRKLDVVRRVVRYEV